MASAVTDEANTGCQLTATDITHMFTLLPGWLVPSGTSVIRSLVVVNSHNFNVKRKANEDETRGPQRRSHTVPSDPQSGRRHDITGSPKSPSSHCVTLSLVITVWL
ncbi:hypothetical protein GJAV_G00240880 [Gymnothorax javanicus]|nr:hypothetical protein GJAV_G00240880 [Gymnothorax javanicus]